MLRKGAHLVTVNETDVTLMEELPIYCVILGLYLTTTYCRERGGKFSSVYYVFVMNKYRQ